jgi:hypothetical protein
MNNKRNRRIAMLIAVLMLTMAFSTTGFAAWMGKTIEAQYRNVTIFVNNQYKQATDVNGKVIEPFIYEGTTYVPLRGISQMLGYEVSFNPQTYRIDITGSGVDPSAQYEILILQARIAELEAKLNEQGSYDLGDLEDDLLSEYKRIDRTLDIEDIILKGDKDDIEVRIYVDLTTQTDLNNWKALLDDGDVEDFLQDVVDDILAQYKDADVEGYIEDKYDKSKLVEFTIDTRGNVKLGSVSNMTLSELEEELYYEFRNYNGIRDFEVTGTTSKIKVDVFAVYEVWEEDLSSTKKKSITNEIIDFIEDEFPSATITGRVISDDQWEDLMYEFKN